MAQISDRVRQQVNHFIRMVLSWKQFWLGRVFCAVFLSSNLFAAIDGYVNQSAKEREQLIRLFEELGNLGRFMQYLFSRFVPIYNSSLMIYYRLAKQLDELECPAQHRYRFEILRWESFPEHQILAFQQLQDDDVFISSLSELKQSPHPLQVCKALLLLNENHLLFNGKKEHIFNCMIHSQHPVEVFNGMVLLQREMMLAGEDGNANIVAIASHSSPLQMTQALTNLKRHGLLSQHYRLSLMTESSPQLLALMMVILREKNLLDELDDVLLIRQLKLYAPILCSERVIHLFWQIPAPQFSLALFANVIHICQQQHLTSPEKIQQIQQLLAQVEPVAPPRQAVILSDPQSVHYSSVNLSVAQFVEGLEHLYEEKLHWLHGVDTNYGKLRDLLYHHAQQLIEQHEKTLQAQAAIRALVRFHGSALLDYLEPVRMVSTKKLMAYIYCAIFDKNKCEASLEDVCLQLIEGLYEIQRGGNLSERGVDNLSSIDSPICPAGTFTKLVEKMQGILKDCHIIFVTRTTISMKLNQVVKGEVKAHLDSMFGSTSQDEFQTLIDELKQKGISDELWQNIRPAVHQRMSECFDEQLLMNANISKQTLQDMIDCGQDVNIDLMHYQPPPSPMNRQHFFVHQPSNSSSSFAPKPI
jgi:hypothetical protein